MKSFYLSFLITSLILLNNSTNLAHAKKIPCDLFKKFPVLLNGCEGEGCGILNYDKSILNEKVFDHPNTKKEIDQLKVCEPIKGFKPVIWLIKPGSAVVAKPSKTLKKMGVSKGDIITVISYEGEGIFSGCVKSKFVDIADSSEISENLVKSISPPQTENWVEIETPRAKKGYIKDHNFYMGHYSFDVSKLCGSDHPFGENHSTLQTKVLKSLENQIKTSCADNSALAEGRPLCKNNDAIWNELKKNDPKLEACTGFELSKALASDYWIGYLHCPKPQNTSEKWQLNFSCQKSDAPSEGEKSSNVECFLGS